MSDSGLLNRALQFGKKNIYFVFWKERLSESLSDLSGIIILYMTLFFSQLSTCVPPPREYSSKPQPQLPFIPSTLIFSSLVTGKSLDTVHFFISVCSHSLFHIFGKKYS